MPEEYQVTLPKLGESIVSATIVEWFKKEGDRVELDEPLLSVSTDKVNSEIPSPVSGVLTKIVAQVDQELQVGELLAVLSLHAIPPVEQETLLRFETPRAPPPSETPKADFYSPALLRMAKEENIPLEELGKIAATGAGGRLSKRDLELYLGQKRASKSPSLKTPPSMAEVERVKMTGMRKTIADNMVRSFYEAPHASLVTEVDVTEIVRWIQQNREPFIAKHGVKITITTFIAQAMVQALQSYPLLNASLEGDTIVVKRFVNLGIAVSVENGILVPVIKNAHALTLAEMARALSDVSQRARSHQLQPSEVQEGTVTLTNFGISGVMLGIPIIRHPEVAIVGMGAIQKKVAVLKDETFGVRSMVHLSLTFDHRVIDGMYGCGFLNSVKENLENPPCALEILK